MARSEGEVETLLAGISQDLRMEIAQKGPEEGDDAFAITIQYEGYEPEFTLSTVCYKAYKHLEANAIAEATRATTQVVLPSRTDALRLAYMDGKKMALYGLMRGNGYKPEDAERTSKSGQDEMDTLVARYGVVAPKNTTGDRANIYKREEITFPRLAATFAEYLGRFIAANAWFRPVAATDALPRYLQFSAGASLCPDATVLAEWILWSKRFNLVINSKKKEKPSADTVEQYARIAFESPYVSKESREELYANMMASEAGLRDDRLIASAAPKRRLAAAVQIDPKTVSDFNDTVVKIVAGEVAANQALSVSEFPTSLNGITGKIMLLNSDEGVAMYRRIDTDEIAQGVIFYRGAWSPLVILKEDGTRLVMNSTKQLAEHQALQADVDSIFQKGEDAPRVDRLGETHTVT